MKFLSSKKALSLVELLLAVFILTVGIGGSLLLFSNAILSTQYAWELTTATTHAEYILEQMQGKNSLIEITSVDWNKIASEEGILILPDESIEVEFSDMFSSPLDILVTVHWSSKSRSQTIALKTKLAK